jgi:CDP-glycerol glycerophosphotransferase (TagB/SpsB family)
MSNGLEQAEAYYHDSRYRVAGLVNALAAKMYPKWVFEHRGRKLLRVPGERVFVMECLNLAPPLPWVFNSGFADAIVVESKKMEEYYQACGLPDDQLKLIGSLADDEMFSILVDRNANKINLCKELEISADKPIILFALPPDFLYMVGGRPECDFSEYRELVRFWVQSIAAQAGGYNVIACLHPSVRYEDFKYIEDWGVRIARKGTADLIPLCDIYVASVSSTIRWAIACGIPVINYDVYRYRYTDYVDVKGVITIEEKTDFIECLHKLANDSDYYAEIAQLQEHASSKWGNLDGKAGERLLQLFTSMIDMYSKERI